MPSSDPTINAAFSAAFQRPLFPLPDPPSDELAAKDDAKSVAEYKAAMEPSRKEARTELDAKADHRQELGRDLTYEEAELFSRAFKTARDTLRVSLKKPPVLKRRAPSSSFPAAASSSSSSSNPTSLRQAFLLAFCRDSTEKPARKDYMANIFQTVKRLHRLFEGRALRWADFDTLRFHLEYLTGKATVGLGEDELGVFHPIWEPVIPLVEQAGGFVLGGHDSVADDLVSFGHVFSKANPDAVILYLCDDGKGNLMHEAWKVGDVLDMIEAKRVREGKLMEHLLLGEARRYLLRMANAFAPVIQRHGVFRRPIKKIVCASGEEFKPLKSSTTFGAQKEGKTIDDRLRFAKTVDVSLVRAAQRQVEQQSDELEDRSASSDEDDEEEEEEEEEEQRQQREAGPSRAALVRPWWETGAVADLGTHDRTLGKRVRTDFTGWTQDAIDAHRRQKKKEENARAIAKRGSKGSKGSKASLKRAIGGEKQRKEEAEQRARDDAAFERNREGFVRGRGSSGSLAINEAPHPLRLGDEPLPQKSCGGPGHGGDLYI